MIELHSVHTSAGNFNLSNINVRINSGDCHVIVGPTGAGKTLLLETIIGLRKLSSGKIIVNGTDVSSFPSYERNISYVPQDTCLFPNMTVNGNIMYGVNIKKCDLTVSAPFLEHLTDFLNIRHLLDRYPQNLSGGEKQRVALVRALATRPVLLVLDEPFSAIDHSMREEIRRLVKKLLAEFKTTTLVVTHDLDEAYFLANEISIMNAGRIVQTGEREDIYYYPKTFEAATFLGIKNIFSGQVENIENNEVVISCKDLNKTITVSCRCSRKRFTMQQSIRFGIRSESVSIMHPETIQEPGNCILDGIVKEFYIRGKMHTAIIEIDGPRKLLVEIDIHDIAAQKSGIKEGTVLKIGLESRNIFILSE